MDGRERRKRRSGRGPAFLALSAMLAAAAPALGAEEVGFVESFTGGTEEYRLERGGHAIPVGVFEPLEVGDRVEVVSEEGRITLQTGAGAVTLGRADGSFVIDGAGEGASVSSNVVAWVGSFLDTETSGGSGVSLVSRSVALDAPLLAAPRQALLRGPRSVALHWTGGRPPYRVRVLAATASDAVVAEAAGLREARAVVEIPEGLRESLRFELSDADGAQETVEVDLVDALPQPGVPLLGEEASASLQETLAALWLGSQAEGRFRLEAFQRVAERERGDPLAAAVADAFASGRQPLPPPVE